jgi:uncharacterized protein (DUF305 family)
MTDLTDMGRVDEEQLEPLPQFGVKKILAVAVAFLVLGFGIGYLVATREAEPSAVDLGFTRDMIDHHDQAVRMALTTLRKPDIDSGVRNFATEVLIFQRWELGIMDTYLAEWHQQRGDLERVAMQWMDMGAPVADMPGMATTDRLAELESATGKDADRLFLTLLREHHRGGIHMSQYAAEHASDSDVRALASRMANYQQVEVNEYTMLMRRLGFES